MTRWLLLALVLIAACSESGERVGDGMYGSSSPAQPDYRVLRAANARRIGGAMIGVTIAGQHALLIADTDARAVRMVASDTHEQLSATSLPGTPAQIVIAGDGQAYVSLRDRAQIAVLRLAAAKGELELAHTLAVASEPIGVAVTPDARTLLVTSGWAAKLTAFAVHSGARLFEVDTAPEPRSVAVTADARRAMITHAAGGLASSHALHEPTTSSATRNPRAVQGFAIAAVGEELVAPGILPGEAKGTGTYGTAEAHALVLARSHATAPLARIGSHARCPLPRAAASDEHTLFLTCLGSDRVAAIRDGTITTRRVPSGPTGIALYADQVFVWSQHTQTLSSLRQRDLEGEPCASCQPDRMTKLDSVVNAPTLSALARRGRTVFHSGTDRRISSDGRACASCHPDGRTDSLNWPTPDGPRQTPMLAGRLGAGPYGWDGGADTLAEHLSTTFQRLGGTGLDGPDLDALLAYLDELPTPPPTPRDDALVARGEALFFQPTVGCATCHRDAVGSDGTQHEVGSGRGLQTPSLRFVSGTAPYFHDGRYATLRDLLVATKGTMGWGADMSHDDIDALEAYLHTL